jgi:ligand-binding sensor domain-containing protein
MGGWRPLRCSLLLVLLGSAAGPVRAETAPARRYVIDVWQGEKGLPQNTVTGIAQTPDGYLWLTTLDGVARFDGMRSKMFKAGDKLAITPATVRFHLKHIYDKLHVRTRVEAVIKHLG